MTKARDLVRARQCEALARRFEDSVREVWNGGQSDPFVLLNFAIEVARNTLDAAPAHYRPQAREAFLLELAERIGMKMERIGEGTLQ